MRIKMSMERVDRETPPITWREEVRYKLHKTAYSVAGMVASRIQRDVAWRVVQYLANAWARYSDRLSVCMACRQEKCSPKCIQAIAARRQQVWNIVEHDSVSMYVCECCTHWVTKCVCKNDPGI